LVLAEMVAHQPMLLDRQAATLYLARLHLPEAVVAVVPELTVQAAAPAAVVVVISAQIDREDRETRRLQVRRKETMAEQVLQIIPLAQQAAAAAAQAQRVEPPHLVWVGPAATEQPRQFPAHPSLMRVAAVAVHIAEPVEMVEQAVAAQAKTQMIRGRELRETTELPTRAVVAVVEAPTMVTAALAVQVS
jgi:hypothetical protein